MGKFWEGVKTIGGSVIKGGLTSGLTGAISSLFGGDKKQLEMQKELNEQAARLNYEYGEKAAENAYQRQLAMYERSYQDQSYSAMRKQMEDAGLSVGLMYGGSGSGGGQGEMSGAPQGATGGAQAGHAPTSVERQMANMQLSQLALTMENLKADVNTKETMQEKNLAEAEAARANAGLTTEKKITEAQAREPMIENMRSDLRTKQMQRIMMDVDTRIKRIELEVAEGTKDVNIEIMKQNLEKARNDVNKGLEEIESLKIDNEIKRETKETVIETYNEKLKNVIADTLLKNEQVNCTKEQAKMFAQAAYDHFMSGEEHYYSSYLKYTQTEALPIKMLQEYEIAELMAKAGITSAKLSSSAQLGSSFMQSLGLLSIGFAKLPAPQRPIGFGK